MKYKHWLVTAVTMMLAFVVAGCGAADSSTQTQGGKTQPQSGQVQTIPGGLQGKKVLVAYYSWSGHTKAAAEQIHDAVGGDLFAVQPAKDYSTDYRECTAVAKEEAQTNARPAVANTVENMAQYDVIFVGYPIWYGKAPMFMYTFLEQYNLQGKVIVPFCTSGGSPLSGSLTELRQAAQGATIVQGLRATDGQDVSPWLTQIGAK